jgi:microcin C transport system substrate-binding protein
MPLMTPARTAAVAALLFAALAVPAFAEAAAPAPGSGWVQGLSLFGTLKYPPGFTHFDYVNPDAPKGGTVRLATFGSFDSFNPVIPRGVPAAGLNLVFETLTTPSLDEVSSEYGLLAESVRPAPDLSSVSYRLRPEARWHDGQPVTPADVVWSFNALKKNSPFYAYYYRNVVKAEQTGPHEVTFTFDQKGNRELPQIVGQMLVLPQHWWEGAGKDGKKRDITRTTLEPPLGSGPYEIASVQPGQSITYRRVKDYWGKDLAVTKGTNNFDEIRYDYYRDPSVAFEAFKAGQYDFRIENSAKNWATGYRFPAREEGKVVLATFPIRNAGIMQAFAFNIRRDKFADRRVREAFNLAMDFEAMNRTLFYGEYQRIESYFQNTELASHGLPQGRELQILDTVKSEVPPEVFTTPYANPTSGNPMVVRDNLRKAFGLLKQAGWTVGAGGLLRDKAGKALTVEFLLDDPNFERVVLFYKQSLKRLGIQVSVREVDEAQYQDRLRNFDYDIIVASWPESLSPGNEQREFWGSAAADRKGSRNYVGIKNPAVDTLIGDVIFAKSREDLVAATHALDRVLLWNDYVVPQWTTDKERYAYWNRFSHPAVLPKYNLGFPAVWWWDAKKAAATGNGP